MVKRIGVQVDAANRGHRVVVVRAEMKREALFRRDETFEILDEDSTDAPISAVFAHHERVQLPYAIVVVYAADLAEGLAVLDKRRTRCARVPATLRLQRSHRQALAMHRASAREIQRQEVQQSSV